MKNPRDEFKNLGTMLCTDNRYVRGDYTVLTRGYCTSWQDMAIRMVNQHDAAIILPLYTNKRHGQVSLSTHPFFEVWENGQIGFIFVSRKSIAEWFDAKYCTKRLITYAKAILLKEVDAYNAYLSGENND